MQPILGKAESSFKNRESHLSIPFFCLPTPELVKGQTAKAIKSWSGGEISDFTH
jgi:hypothetical protein